jgi:hypothetical protein
MHTVPQSVTLPARKYEIKISDTAVKKKSLLLFLFKVPSQWHTPVKIKARYLVSNVKLVLPLDDFRYN